MIDPGVAVVKALLRVFPRAFREQFAQEMLSTFLDLRDAQRDRGEPSWRSTMRTATSLVRSLPVVYADERARRMHLPPRNTILMTIAHDIRRAARSLRTQPGFAAIAILTLALGIGANTAVFSVLDSVVLAPLPYSEPDRIVRLYGQSNWSKDPHSYLTGPDIVDVRNDVKSFAAVGIVNMYRETGIDLSLDGVAQRIRVLPVNADYFAALGATPAMGRVFGRDEERAGVRYVILSHELWSTVMQRDPAVLGRQMVLNGVAFEVIGVMRSGFRDIAGSDVMAWIPQDLQPGGNNSRSNSYLSAVARLAPGVSVAQAQQELNGVMARLRRELPDSNHGQRMNAVPLHDDVIGESRTPVYVLMGAASLVLLIACLNVASLFLARAVAQSRDTAIRTALGARRSRLVSERLTESVLVAMIGGVVGTVVAYAGVKGLLMVSPASLARAEEVGFNAQLLGFALVTTIATGLLFGTAPAVRASRTDPMDALHDSSRGNTEGRQGRRWRSVLVAGQVACAVVLLIGAGTLIRSFVALQQVDLGFVPDSVVTFDINLPNARYGDPLQRVQFHHRFRESLAAITGVSAVGAVSWLPANGPYHIWGYQYVDANGEPRSVATHVRVVDGDFFGAVRATHLTGATFGPGLPSDSNPAAIINEHLAQAVYRGASPIGKQFVTGNTRFTIIGVVSDMAFDATGARANHVYVSHDEFAGDRNWPLSYVVRSANNTDAMNAARRALHAIDPLLVLYRPRSLDAVLGVHRARQEFTLLLMAAFAAVALTLAAVGVYGVLSYSVTQRTHEIGVRMALGARVGQVRGIVLSHGALVAGIGLVIGLASAFALGGVLRSLVFGVGPRDPLVFIVVTVVLAGVTIVAAFIPARRATTIDPGIALRAG